MRVSLSLTTLEVITDVSVDLRVSTIVSTNAINAIQAEGQIALRCFNTDHVIDEAAIKDRNVTGSTKGFNFLVTELPTLSVKLS